MSNCEWRIGERPNVHGVFGEPHPGASDSDAPQVARAPFQPDKTFPEVLDAVYAGEYYPLVFFDLADGAIQRGVAGRRNDLDRRELHHLSAELFDQPGELARLCARPGDDDAPARERQPFPHSHGLSLNSRHVPKPLAVAAIFRRHPYRVVGAPVARPTVPPALRRRQSRRAAVFRRRDRLRLR